MSAQVAAQAAAVELRKKHPRPKPAHAKRLYSRAEAATYIARSVRTVDKLVEQKMLRRLVLPSPTGTGAKPFVAFDRADLDAYIDSGRTEGLR